MRCPVCGCTLISIHALLAESDSSFCQSNSQRGHFYPRSPCGERQFVARLYMYRSNKFLSTLSLRRATRSYTRPYRSVLFLSTLSLRRATGKRSILYTPQEISIHALLAESDQPDAELYTMLRISIHALLAESDIAKFAFMTNLSLFLSTLSLRRATQQKCGDRKAHVNFYPRSPCGERLNKWVIHDGAGRISIHALLAESDATST